MAYLDKKKHKLSWKKIEEGLVEVKLTNKLNGDIQIGYGQNIAKAVDDALETDPVRPKFEPKTILRKVNNEKD